MTEEELGLALARRWSLSREDLDIAADALKVPRVTDEEWAEIVGPS
jgi:hypothetical protein